MNVDDCLVGRSLGIDSSAELFFVLDDLLVRPHALRFVFLRFVVFFIVDEVALLDATHAIAVDFSWRRTAVALLTGD